MTRHHLTPELLEERKTQITNTITVAVSMAALDVFNEEGSFKNPPDSKLREAAYTLLGKLGYSLSEEARVSLEKMIATAIEDAPYYESTKHGVRIAGARRERKKSA